MRSGRQTEIGYGGTGGRKYFVKR